MVNKISFGIYKGYSYKAFAIPDIKFSEIIIPALKINQVYPGFLSYDQIHEEAYKLIDSSC